MGSLAFPSQSKALARSKASGQIMAGACMLGFAVVQVVLMVRPSAPAVELLPLLLSLGGVFGSTSYGIIMLTVGGIGYAKSSDDEDE